MPEMVSFFFCFFFLSIGYIMFERKKETGWSYVYQLKIRPQFGNVQIVFHVESKPNDNILNEEDISSSRESTGQRTSHFQITFMYLN